MTQHHTSPEAPDDPAPGRLRPILLVVDEVNHYCTDAPPPARVDAVVDVLRRARTAGIAVFPCSMRSEVEVSR